MLLANAGLLAGFVAVYVLVDAGHSWGWFAMVPGVSMYLPIAHRINPTFFTRRQVALQLVSVIVFATGASFWTAGWFAGWLLSAASIVVTAGITLWWGRRDARP